MMSHQIIRVNVQSNFLMHHSLLIMYSDVFIMCNEIIKLLCILS